MTKHTNGCDGKNVYTDFNMYGLSWTCYCGAVAMNSIVGANYKHRDAKKEPLAEEVDEL